MRVDAFDFHLPPQAIADRPANPRDSARLLHVGPQGLTDHIVRDLPDLLHLGDLLISNDTKVIPARLRGKRGTAGVEVTLHQAVGPGRWLAFARPAKKLTVGDRLDIAEDFSAQISAKGEMGEVTLDFGCDDGTLLASLERYGSMPLPPYIRGGKADGQDRSDYQTLFARTEGAVAAPTAGLHFTPDLLARLDAKGVAHATLTLHVGAGTFLPVKVDDTDEHRMHSEWGHLTAELAAKIVATKQRGGRIVAVGTTTARLLESAAQHGDLKEFCGSTDIFITPGFDFKVVDVLMTNFHLPRSTLFMLVSAFAGLERMRAAYDHAIGAGYRFYSYGDACLLERA